MSFKMTHPMLVGLVLDSYKQGLLEGDPRGYQRAQDSVSALLAENNQLKRELEAVEERMKVQLRTAAQRDCFPAVREEQKRIVKTIRAHFSKADCYGPAWSPEEINNLLLVLALGDIE